MSKNLKRIISCTLLVGSLCFAGQISDNLFMNKAEAATVAVQAGEIRTMTVKTYDNDELEYVNNFEDCDTVEYDGNKRDFKVVIPDDIKDVKVNFEVKQKDDVDEDQEYVARVYSSSADDAYPYESGDKIEIKKDYTTLYVRVYKNEDKFKDAKNDDDVSKCYDTYKIILKKESAEVDEDEADTGNGSIVSTGDNIQLPKIESNATAEVKVVKNQWVQKGAYWVRYNENGETLKNTWYQEKGKWYYLKGNGYMTIGWRFIDGKYYFFDESGAMKTGWVQSNGKWYYLNSAGDMASNITVDGYRLNVSGEYVG